MIFGRALQQVTEEILSKSTYQPDQAESSTNQHAIPPINIVAQSVVKRSRKEKRMEARKKWFLRKKKVKQYPKQY